MSTIYRKSSVNSRVFYKVQDMEYVTRVTNKLWTSSIDVSRNPIILSEANDNVNAVATAEEFNTAYKEAMERIQSGRLDVHERD